MDVAALIRLFDGRTMFLTGALVAGLFAPIMLAMAYIRKPYPGYRQWALAEGAFALTFLGQVVRGMVADFIPVVVANFFAFSALYLLAEGMYLFLGRRFSRRTFLFVLAACYAGMLYLFLVHDDMRIRTILQGAVFAFYVAVAAWPLIGRPPRGQGFSYSFALGTFGFGFLISVVRVVALLCVDSMRTMFTGNPVDTAYYISNLLFLIGITFSFFLLVNERYLSDLYQSNDVLFQEITERKDLEKRLRKLSKTDELTHVLNRRGILDAMENEVQRASRLRHPLAVLMFDLDEFKPINDTHGHAAGDRVLLQLAETCVNHLRVIDSVGRAGGDEFVVILPETRLQEALLVAEKLRVAIAENPFVEAELRIPLTVSIGVVAWSATDPTGVDTFLKADRALYLAKQAGRNCVRTVADDPALEQRL